MGQLLMQCRYLIIDTITSYDVTRKGGCLISAGLLTRRWTQVEYREN